MVKCPSCSDNFVCFDCRELQPLIGKRILAAMLGNGDVRSGDRDNMYLRFVADDGNVITYFAEGDCCAIAWIAGVSGMVEPPFTILNARLASYTSKERASFEVLDTGTYLIYTDKGTIAVELRVSHNGYYGGSLILYDGPDTDGLAFKPLVDFSS